MTTFFGLRLQRDLFAPLKNAAKIICIWFGLLTLCGVANANVTVTTATGGGAIASNTAPACSAAGTWTTLTGPVVAEGNSGDISTGGITLSAPSGFEFNTAATVTIRLAGNTTASRNINGIANGSSVAVTSITATAITFTVTSASTRTNTLTWQGIQVRPTASTPLASGNITKTGTSSFNGAANGSNLGTLTEVTSVPACLPPPPAVTTGSATALTTTGATLNGTVTSNGAATTVTFEYGLNASYGATVTATQSPLGAGATNSAVTVALTGLTCNTLYHYRVNGVSIGGTANGGDITFTTSLCPTPPSVTTNAATLITSTGAKLNGTVTSNGAATAVSFEYGPTTSYGTTVIATQSPLAGSASNAAVSYTLTGLSCKTTYHFRVKGDNGSGPVNGSDVTFTTLTGSLCPIAQYTLDDQTWNDSSGSGYNGAVGGFGGTAPTFSIASPAVVSTPTTGTCGYRSFSRPDKTYIYLPSTFPNMGADDKAFTITAWIRTTDNTQSGQRIFIDDEGIASGASGYGFSLGDGGQGTVRFFTRGTVTPTTNSPVILDTPNVIANNTWYFVAAVADVPNKTKYVYVFNTAGTRLALVSKTWTDTSFGSDGGIASIGGETNASGENTGSFGFAGNLDEVRVYSGALSQTDLATVQGITRPCPDSVAPPGTFNACDATSPKCTPTTLPDVSYAVLANKVAGQSFNLDAVALLSGGTLNTSFSGNVQVDLLANLASGVAIGSDNCPVSQNATIDLGSNAFVSGRVSISSIVINPVYSDVRVRFTCTALVCGTAVSVCSTDNFAVVPPPLDHYEVSLPASSISCLATTVTVTACANTSSPCTSTYAGANGSTATLATTGATLGATSVTFNKVGVATTTLSYPTATDGTTASVTLSGVSLSAANASQCCQGSSCTAANSCTTTFSTAGFVFSSTAGGAVATIPTQVAGTSSGTHYLRAVKTSTTTGVCTAALTGATNVDMAYQCNNPTTCSASDLMSVNGGTATTIARNPNSAAPTSYTSVPVTFDSGGNAPLTFNYSDAGLVTLFAKTTVNSAPLTGSSNAFVTKPASFALTATCGTTTNAASQTSPSVSDAKFCPAGQNFSVSVSAMTSGGVVTPNYGKEIINLPVKAETIAATWSRYLPTTATGGVDGTLPSGTLALSDTIAGTFTADTLNWSEVGILKAVLAVGDGSYLEAGNVTSTAFVGRFYPHHFDVVVTPQCGGFVYSGQPATTVVTGQPFTVNATAMNGLATPTATSNYYYNTTAGFSKVVDLTLSAGGSSGKLYVGATAGGSGAIPATKFSAGAGQVNFSDATGKISYVFDAFPTVSTTITLHADDADSKTSTGTDGSTMARAGRLRLLNAYGSERLDLPMALTVEYWKDSGWLRNADDSCTTGVTLAKTDPVSTDALATADVFAWDTGSPGVSGIGYSTAGTTLKQFKAAASAGNFNLNLRAPGVGLTGAMDITATGPAWLRFDWTGAGNANPVGRATFGVFKSPLIYRRENY